MIDLENRRVLVVGLAKTGLSTAIFLKERRAIVKVSEIRLDSEIKEMTKKCVELGIEVEAGEHNIDSFLKSDLIVLSPGVPLYIEPVKKAIDKGIMVISEIELAYSFIKSPIIAITGTNGKTTTTTIIGEILKKSFNDVYVGGNIGNPLIGGLNGDWKYVVVEVSSFQLEGIRYFKPYIAILLNISNDHLDRYRSIEEYREAKFRIFMNQNHNDFAILRDDLRDYSKNIMANKIYFSINDVKNNIYSEFSLKNIKLKGPHNIENVMAAIIVAKILKCPDDYVYEVLSGFNGLPHRLEFVGMFNGISFYNDSKGTNVDSVYKALQSFRGPIILIAGGRDKGGDFGLLTNLIKERVKKIILIGEAKEKIYRSINGIKETFLLENLKDAVRLAYRMGNKGDVILLSPGCSSFDMFKNYEERGNRFKEAVYKIINGK
jgi:UDP-N-acetylmuramoylalanine--D-glutamate ligase